MADQKKASSVQRETVWQAGGCEACNNTGYKSRVGIYEAIRMDETVEEIVRRNPSEREIKLAAHSQGILSMPQDGVMKVLKGTTSFEELTRVIDLSEDIAPPETKDEADL